MKYPALEVAGAPDNERLLALLDDFSPSAITDVDDLLTVYFTSPADRNRAAAAVARTFPHSTTCAREVDDEDWARRSQENLTPISVGRIVVTPPWHVDPAQLLCTGRGTPPPLPPLTIVIAPSMGFGTGHHATTRLCLAALQRVDIEGRVALDVGTGSGVLAIAARVLGARTAIGVDSDADAVHAATENLGLNPAIGQVGFEVGDLRDVALPLSDIVTANLTGALLIRSASVLLGAVRPGGSLIVSGIQDFERDDVVQALAPTRLVWEAAEDGWVVLVFRFRL